jgi:valyl-tRNA synthetase
LHTSQKAKVTDNTRKKFPHGIPSFGADPLRFTYCALASTGRDIRFDLGRIEGYRNFCNKLWNAARYVFAHAQEEDHDFGDRPVKYNLGDQWIISRLQHTIKQTQQHFSAYRFDLLANALYEFTQTIDRLTRVQ